MAEESYRNEAVASLLRDIASGTRGNNLFLRSDRKFSGSTSSYVLTSPEAPRTLESMDQQNEQALTDAKIAAAEARTDTKFAHMDGKLDRLLTEMQGVRSDTKNSRNVVSTTVVGSALALAALIYTLFSYGAAQFYNGTVVRDLVHQEVLEKAPSQTPAPK